MTLKTISPTVARRLAIVRQRRDGSRPKPDGEGIMEVARDLGCFQLDPISAVARSHLLVIWSRLGNYNPTDLDHLLWEDRALFEYWGHAASIVLTEDYPVHNHMMRRYAKGDSGWAGRVQAWLEENAGLRDYVLAQIRERGPVQSKNLEDTSVKGWRSTGWTEGQNVTRMLDFLWTRGEIMVAGRVGGQRLWDLAERCLPEWTPREALDSQEVVRRAAQKSLRALGVATRAQIAQHYTRGRYPQLQAVLDELERVGTIIRLRVSDGNQEWPGPWYAHKHDLPLLERLERGEWQPRTTLLSPFDNLICDRARTELMFGFRFRIEIYVPKAQRQYGYYVLPILHGDRLIGRVDPSMDRKAKVLRINAVHAEPDLPDGGEIAPAVAGAINELAAFLAAEEVVYCGQVPAEWKHALTF